MGASLPMDMLNCIIRVFSPIYLSISFLVNNFFVNRCEHLCSSQGRIYIRDSDSFSFFCAQ